MAHPSNFYMEKQPLHYFSGRVRAFWDDFIFFSDARNVAVIKIHDVFKHGNPATPRDLACLEELVERSDWQGAPEFHSYVSEYPRNFPCPWPYNYKLSGKTLWMAKCAWFGVIPNSIRNLNMSQTMHDIVRMPLSYYTGRIQEFYNDKILFGDMRNSVIVNSDNFYVNGERCFKENFPIHPAKASGVTVHAYIIRLDVLEDNPLGGPEPDLPTWSGEGFSTAMWMAKFAWYGQMPDIVRDQLERYDIIRMNQWREFIEEIEFHRVPWKRRDVWQGHANENSRKEFGPKDKQGAPEKERSCQFPVPQEQCAGFMKGSLLVADKKQGLITSYADLIAFSKDNFYVNGQKFRHSYDLSLFFQNRRVLLTAWVIPFDKPKVIFNIKVVWHAVCVWYGAPPEELEYIKGACGNYDDNLIETSIPISRELTYFSGNVHRISHGSGVLMSTAGLDQAVRISFDRKVFYLYGSKFHSSCSLLDKQQILENNVWSVLAYPVWTDDVNGTPKYQALVMWHHNDQHTMNMLYGIISEYEDLRPTLQNTDLNETRDHVRVKEELIQDLSGSVAKVTEDYGIIESKSGLADAMYICFRKDVLFLDGHLLSKNVRLQSIRQGRQCSVDAKTIAPKNIEGYQVTMEASLVWIGRKPVLESSRKLTPDCSEKKITNSCNDRETFAIKQEAESCRRPEKILHAAEGVMVGTIFIVEDCDGLIICSDIIAAFSSDIFYVNGNKFTNKYGSLNKFCSDRKIIVRAMIVTLKEPKVVLNCLVRCEAVCVWIGKDQDDRTLLQRAHHHKNNQTSGTSKISQESLLYFRGRMTPSSKDGVLLASTTPEGTSRITFLKENIFVNGTAVHQDNTFEQCKSSQNWSVLALPIPPKNIMGHSVCYAAVAVWDVNHHHKMRKVLLSVSCKRSTCEKFGLSSASNSNERIPDTLDGLLHTLKIEDKFIQNGLSSQLKDPLVIVSQIVKESSGGKSDIASSDLSHFVSVKEFCGKHITGYIVKKFKGGGVAEWKSLLFEGYVFIEFSIESLYLNSGPVNEKWKVSGVQSRPCNFYVVPIPHHSVGEYMISLKATCGWMGKKPSHLPSPGTQLFPKIDLSSVYVSKPPEIQNSELKLEMEIPEECYQNGDKVTEVATSETPPQLSNATKGKAKESMIHGTQNGEASRMNCNTQSQAPSLLSSEHQKAAKKKCEKIWQDENKKGDHHRGTIIEVHSSVGQLEGVDGSQYYFSRENCYLFGVPLHNVELWHVLAQDDRVLYTVMELVPGMKKAQRVWLGALELPDKRTVTEDIVHWCRVNMVPDGAREILLSQLEMQ